MDLIRQEMASRQCKFVSEPADVLKCAICLELARDPHQHEECGKLFCKECIEKYGRDKPCPHCRTQGSQYFRDNKSKYILVRVPNFVNALTVLFYAYFPALTASKMVSKLSLASTGITDQGTKQRLPLTETSRIVLLTQHNLLTTLLKFEL